MITKEEIINAYWDTDERRAEVAKILEEYEVLGGEYDLDGYQASIYVLMRKDGRLYEFSSSHCSCNGFEDFKPEEVTLEALVMRDNSKYGVGHESYKALKESGLL